MGLTASFSSSSSLAEKSSIFKSLADALGSGSSLAEKSSVFRSLSGSLSLASYGNRGSFFTENLQGKFGTTRVLSGHSDCFENVIVNCGSVSASFAFLVVAFAVLVFGIYATKQRRQSRAQPGGLKTEESFVDKEGWETRGFNDEERRETKGSDDEEGWESKAED
jgi:hypothetical protein